MTCYEASPLVLFPLFSTNFCIKFSSESSSYLMHGIGFIFNVFAGIESRPASKKRK
jgi:hypothetical protein